MSTVQTVHRSGAEGSGKTSAWRATNQELVGNDPSERNWRGIFISLLVIIIVLGLILTAIVLVTPSTPQETLVEPFSFEDMMSDQFKPRNFDARWIGESDTFVYKSERGELVSYNADGNVSTLLVDNHTLRSLKIDIYFVSADLNYILLGYDKKMVYRHSYTAKYLIYDRRITDPEERQISFPSSVNDEWKDRRLQFAGWSPHGHQLTYVYENNLYHQPDPYSTPTQVTENGQPNMIYNGIPDWLYEEEVLDSNVAHWWSPSGEFLCFVMFDDSQVPLYKYPYYGKGTNIYGKMESVAYPKAGDEEKDINPTFKIYSVKTSNVKAVQKQLHPPALSKVGRSFYFTLVQWRDNNHVMIAWSNRAQNKTVLIICDVISTECVENLEETSKEGRGWVTITDVMFIDGGRHFLTILPVTDGENVFWKHVNMIPSPVDTNGRVKALTEGAFEVSKILAYDDFKKLVYYTSTNGDPRKSHVYRAGPINTNNVLSECLTCNLDDQCQYNTAVFSRSAKLYILHCLGPGIPTYTLRSTMDHRAIMLEDNSNMRSSLQKKDLPLKEYFEFTARDGTVINGEMLLPAGLKKHQITMYPLLVYTYNGPGSQLVKDEFKLGMSTYLSSTENVIYVSIDGRGTAGRGDNFLHQVYHNLGVTEVTDQIDGAKYLADKYGFVDKRRIAIWGRSYGGFVVVHALGEPGSIFTCGVAVAPIVDWRYYDTAFTERYMGFSSASENFRGYDNANASRKVENLRDKNFMIIHGTADVNVHFQHSAQLIKALNEAQVEFRTQMYIDSDHSMTYSERHIYRTITNFLKRECWEGGKPRDPNIEEVKTEKTINSS